MKTNNGLLDGSESSNHKPLVKQRLPMRYGDEIGIKSTTQNFRVKPSHLRC